MNINNHSAEEKQSLQQIDKYGPIVTLLEESNTTANGRHFLSLEECFSDKAGKQNIA